MKGQGASKVGQQVRLGIQQGLDHGGLAGLGVQWGLYPKWEKEPGEVLGRKRPVRFCLLGQTLWWLEGGGGLKGEMPEAEKLTASDSPRAKEFFKIIITIKCQ